jgi:hypothetical protein
MHSQNYKLTPDPAPSENCESENCFAIFLLRVRSNKTILSVASSCFVYFMLRCPLVVKTASAGFSPIGGQPPKWPPSGHSKSKYSENTPIHYIKLFLNTCNFFLCIAQLSGWFHWMCQGYFNKLFLYTINKNLLNF